MEIFMLLSYEGVAANWRNRGAVSPIQSQGKPRGNLFCAGTNPEWPRLHANISAGWNFRAIHCGETGATGSEDNSARPRFPPNASNNAPIVV
jgi:hypothetical protein